MFGRWAALCITAVLGVAAPAAIADSSTPADSFLSPSLDKFVAVDTQLTQFQVTVSCPADPQLGAPCPMTVSLSWHPANLRTYKAVGPDVALGAKTVTLQPGQATTLTMSADPRKLRDVTARRHVAATAIATLVDNRTGQKVDQATHDAPVGAYDRCPGPAYAPFTGGSVTALDRNYDGSTSRTPVISGAIGVGEAMLVGDQPVRLSVLGVTYILSPHTSFDRTCWGLTDYHRGQAAPTVVLTSGTVHVTGKPYGAQIWTGVGTPEGNLGSRSQERVDFTVSRDAHKQLSTRRVAVGRTTQVTPFNHPTRSPCTNGQALEVDRYGHIRKI
jgi:hypothetical protein